VLWVLSSFAVLHKKRDCYRLIPLKFLIFLPFAKYWSLMSNPMRKESLREPMEKMEMDRACTSSTRLSELSPQARLNFRKQEPSCMGSCDVCKCCPTKSQLRDEPLYNRMIMCFFAICLMWATSLKVASSVADAFIDTPSGSDIFATCEDAYDLISVERQEYVQCVEVQLGQCNINLAQAADAEAERIETSNEYNKAVLESARQKQSDCSAAFSGARFEVRRVGEGRSS